MGRKAQRLSALVRNLIASRARPQLWPRAVFIARRAIRQYGAFQKLSELAPLVGIVAKLKPRAIVEIGTGRGGTLWAWCQVAADDATIVTINLPGGGFEVGDLDSATVRSYARGQQRIEILPGDSHDPDVLAHASSLLGRQPDFVFVDGDHTYAGVQTDYQMYAPLLRPGGLIVFHDIVKHRVETGCEVDRLWDEIKSAYDYTELADQRPDPGRGPWGGIGVLRVPEDRR